MDAQVSCYDGDQALYSMSPEHNLESSHVRQWLLCTFTFEGKLEEFIFHGSKDIEVMVAGWEARENDKVSLDTHRNAGIPSFSPGFQGAGLGDALRCFCVVRFSEPNWSALLMGKSSLPLVTVKRPY